MSFRIDAESLSDVIGSSKTPMNISISNCDTASTIKRYDDQSIDIMTFNQTCRYRVLMGDHPEGEGQE